MTSTSNCNLLSSSKTTGEEDHHAKHQPQSFPSQTHSEEEEEGKDQVRERMVLLQGEGRTAPGRGRGGGNNDNTRLQLQSQEESVTSTASEEMMKRDDSGREQDDDDDGRERLKRHRNEMAGRVRIPETWGQEDFLMEWMDCTVFDALLAPAGLISARAALVREGGFRVVSSGKLRYT